MRLLSVFFTAAIVTFGFAGGASAQEQSTGRALEVHKMTGTESTTQPPTSGRRSRNALANAACPGAVELGSVPPAGKPPTDDDLRIGPFPVTGESFRLTYETSDANRSGLPFFDAAVLDAADKRVGGQVIFDEGVVTETVRAGPGKFTIRAVSDDLKYRITVEDCTGGSNPPPNGPGGGQPNPTNSSGDQYNNDTGNPNDVVDNTVSDKPLPNTGGVPLLGAGFFGFVCVFAAFALLRPAIHRDT